MGDNTVTLYYASVSSSAAKKKQQREMEDIVKMKHMTLEKIDITLAGNEDKRQFMRDNSKKNEGEKVPLPPQLFKGEEYLGDYNMFLDAVECDTIDVFLGLATKIEVSESSVEVTGGKDD